jgi:P27 family predicted phage terminase small subunit
MGARGRKSLADKQAAEIIALRPQEPRQRQNVPAHLHEEGRRFYEQMLADHDIVDAGSLAVLTRACECIDTISAARRAMSKDGPLVLNQYDLPKAHPALAVEKAARDGFYAALRMLGIKMKTKGNALDVPWDR